MAAGNVDRMLPLAPVRSRIARVVALTLLLGLGSRADSGAAEAPRRFPTPPAWRAWAGELQRADSLVWAYRAVEAERAAIAVRDRARAQGAAWPEMSADVIAAAADALLGRAVEAERFARAGQTLARRLGDAGYDRRAMRWLAFALEAQGRAAASDSVYRALLRAATPARDTLHMGAAHLGIGYGALQRGNLGVARRHYERALPLLERAGNPVLAATAQVGLARTLHELGEFEREQRIYMELLGQARRANLGRNELDALNNLGAIAYAQGDAVRAVSYWRLALARQRGLHTQEAAPVAVDNLVLALNDLGRFDEASALLDSAIAAARRGGRREAIATLEIRRGEQLMVRERPGEALEAYRRAEALVSEGQVSLLVKVRIGILRASSSVETPQACMDYAARALQPLVPLVNGIERGELQVRLGEAALAAGRVHEAVALFASVAEAGHDSGMDRSRTAVALYNQGCALRRLALADSARATLGRAVAEWEAWRTEGRGSRWQELDTFEFSWLPVEYADALLGGRDRDPHRLTRVWGVLQAGRSRAVLDRLTGGSAATRTSATLSLARVRASLLAPGDLLLDFYAGQHATLLFAITREHVRLVRLPPVDSLGASLQAWYRLLSAPPSPASPPGALDAARDRISDRLLGALSAELRAARRVILSPDGPASLIPLESLTIPVAGGREAIAARREVWRVPSASVLASLRSRPRPGEVRVLAVRGAADASHPALRGAGAEVAFLRRRLAGTQVYDCARSPALPLENELAPWGVLHFAAHARSLGQSPWESGLLCADSVAAGGAAWLTARQIGGMRLGARLAFLSGCETAGGRVLGGEGVMGLASAFLSAGVPCVVASLWAVDDAATARLVEVFYERLLAGDSVALALEAGRGALRRDPETAPPHYWAGFIVVGDGSQRIAVRSREFGRP